MADRLSARRGWAAASGARRVPGREGLERAAGGDATSDGRSATSDGRVATP